MRWREALDIRAGQSPDVVFDEMESFLDPGESVGLVAAPVQWYDTSVLVHRYPDVGMMVASNQVMFGKKSLFGRPKIRRYPISDFVRHEVFPFSGAVAQWELQAQLQSDHLRILFRTHDEADDVSSMINRNLLFWRRAHG